MENYANVMRSRIYQAGEIEKECLDPNDSEYDNKRDAIDKRVKDRLDTFYIPTPG